MKLTSPIAIASIACSGMIPAVSALLGTSCISAVNALAQLPGLLIEHMQRQTCAHGCEPTVQTWQHAIKGQVIGELVDDGVKYCDAPDAREAFTSFLDQLMSGTADKCKDKLDTRHLCHDPDAVQPFIDCVNGKSKSAVAGSMHTLLPYMNEARCKKAAEYFTGEQLWEKDFPEHIQEYISVCHEL
ncbi:hypothetical protein BDV26DRAFT_289266 [Aspergillus bertholletiae]|uniref:Uncharacterized protein n=1 Tax=Aspergillus bertholletiae TaxID=1226010 RepID=A0A5N7BJE5_9EURO|nr:hypothetical protein BDV26DRAFT_289266 [Aspergillus bertholletiae]